LNIFIVQFVLTDSVDFTQFEWNMGKSPCHVIIIHTCFADHTKGKEVKRRLNDLRMKTGAWSVEDAGYATVWYKTDQYHKVTPVAEKYSEYKELCITVMSVQHFDDKPMMMIIVSRRKEQAWNVPYQSCFKKDFRRQIEKHNPTVVAGIFDCTPEDVETLVYPEGRVFFQSWWAPDVMNIARSDDDCTARHFSLDTEHVPGYVAYPAFFIFFGHSTNVASVPVSNSLKLPWFLRDCAVARCFRPLGDMPRTELNGLSMLKRTMQPWNITQVKTKKYSELWQVRGVHQQVLWLGTSNDKKKRDRGQRWPTGR
jgi:hypothetical protein